MAAETGEATAERKGVDTVELKTTDEQRSVLRNHVHQPFNVYESTALNLLDDIDTLQAEVARLQKSDNVCMGMIYDLAKKCEAAEAQVTRLQQAQTAYGVALLEKINANAESDMLKGNPITGAHHRQIEKELARLKKEAEQNEISI